MARCIQQFRTAIFFFGSHAMHFQQRQYKVGVWKSLWEEEEKKETKENKVARCHPAVLKCSKKSVPSAAAVQSRCQEVASCWRIEKSRSRMRKEKKKENRKIGWPGAIRQVQNAVKKSVVARCIQQFRTAFKLSVGSHGPLPCTFSSGSTK